MREQINLILSADSMLKVAKIVLISKRPIVVLACSGWLFINVVCYSPSPFSSSNWLTTLACTSRNRNDKSDIQLGNR